MHDVGATERFCRPITSRLAAAALAMLLVTAMAACGGDGDDAAYEEARTSTSTSLPSSEPTCEDGTLKDRRFILCTAGDAPDQTLVVALHGRGSSADEMRAVTELDRYAAERGLAVVYPDGLEGGWGDDTFTTPTRPSGDEDVTFLDTLVATLQADLRINDQPVGFVGFSNGASMALRYATQRPDATRAVVSVAGQLPRDPSIRPFRPVSLLEIYGTADPVRRYDAGIPDGPNRQPGQPTPTLSTPDTIAAFIGVAPGLEGPAEAEPHATENTRLRTERWTADDGTVIVLRTIVDGGHTWPSAHAPLAAGADYGAVSRDLDASAEAIAFIMEREGQAG